MDCDLETDGIKMMCADIVVVVCRISSEMEEGVLYVPIRGVAGGLQQADR